jgi:UrcA family protein
MRMPINLVLAALAVAVADPAVASAADVSVAVSYADLDLAKPAGTQALQSRIDRALDKVCAKPDIREIKAMQDYEACQAKARGEAMSKLSLANPFDGIELASAF